MKKYPAWTQKEIQTLIAGIRNHKGHNFVIKTKALLPNRSISAVRTKVIEWRTKHRNDPDSLSDEIKKALDMNPVKGWS